MGDVITKIMHADPTPLELVVRDSRPLPRKAWPKVELVDPALSALVMKALTKSREDRYQTAREFRQAVETYLGIDPGSDRTDQGAKRKNSKRLLFAAACGVAIAAGLLAVVRPFADVRNSRADAPPPVSLDGKSEELLWNSFDQEMSDLAEDDFITRTSDGWRIRQREVRFSELSSDMLVFRAVLRRNSQGRVRLQLQARDGTKVTAEVSRKLGTDTDVVSLDMSARDFIAEHIELPSGIENKTELALAVLPDRVTLAYNGRVAVQMHCRPANGPWTPVLDVKSADIDCLALEYAQPATAPAGFFADVLPVEAPVVEFIVRHGGAALSQPKSHAADATFHLTSLTTDDSSNSVAASEIAKITRCASLTKLKLQHLSEPREAVEQIATLKKLTHLDIGYSKLDGDCFSHFGTLDQLESLGLGGTPMETADVRPLLQLRSLENLFLMCTFVSDADLELLADIKSLRRIGMLGEQVSSKGVHSLLRLRELKWIDLRVAKLSGDGVLYLSQFPKLSHLDITGSDIGDADIPSLEKMTQLHRLIVNDTQLTKGGVDTLRSTLPNCDIRFTAD